MQRIWEANPLNRKWRLADGLLMRLLALPHNSGGSKWYDIAGVSHGTLTNGPAWATQVRQGGFAGLSFDGSNDRVVLSSISLTGAKTISFWAKWNTTPNNVILGGAFAVYYPYIDGSNVYISTSWGVGSNISHGGITTGVWYQFTIAGDGTTATVYKNGISLGAAIVDRTPTVGAIGMFSSGDGQYQFNGTLDDFCIWNRALSAPEIMSLYRDTSSGYQQSLNWRKSRPAVASVASSGATFVQLERGIRGLNRGIAGGF